MSNSPLINLQRVPSGASKQSKQKKKTIKPEPMNKLDKFAIAYRTQYPEYTSDLVQADFKDQQSLVRQAAEKYVNEHYFKQRSYDILLGRKIHNSIVEKLGDGYQNLSIKDRKILDLLLLEDDFDMGSILKKITKAGSQYVLPLLRPAVETFAPQFASMLDSFLPKTVSTTETIRVTRRYMLVSVVQAVDNEVQKIDINPGLKQFGQWLSLIAQAYQYYRIHKMTIEYIPATALTTQGNISYYLEIDNNARTPGLADLPQQYKSSTHALYQNNTVSYVEEELHQGLKRLHCRNDAIPTLDIDQYDIGRFFYGCSSPSTVAYGQFYLDIDLSFFVPTLQSLSIDYVFQYQLNWNPTSFIFPINDFFVIDPLAVRTFQGQNCQGFKVLQSGTLRTGIQQTGTGTATATSYCQPVFASTIQGTTAISSAVYAKQNNAGGNQMFIGIFTLPITVGGYVWFMPSSAAERLNGSIEIGCSLNSNFFPTVTLQKKRPDDQSLAIQTLQQELQQLKTALRMTLQRPPPLQRQSAVQPQSTERKSDFSAMDVINEDDLSF